jgi:type II secretory pathway pseudopilin PulG
MVMPGRYTPPKTHGGHRANRSFTLIELVVVLIILGILTLASFATFNTVSATLSTNVAAGNMQQVLASEIQYSNTTGGYSDSPNTLTGIQKSLSVIVGPATTAGEISVATDPATGRLGMAAVNTQGSCLLEVANPANTGAQLTVVPWTTGTACLGSSALVVSNTQIVDTSQTYDSLEAASTPSAWWRLSDSVGSGTAIDSAPGGANPGTINGPVTFGVTGGPGTPADAAASFASNGYVSTGFSPSGGSGFSVTAWANLNGTTPTTPMALVSDTTPSSNSGFSLVLGGSDDTIPQITIGNGTLSATVTSDVPIDNTNWNQITATWDGSTVTLYVDGSAVGSTSLSGSLTASSTVSLGQLGNDTEYFTGSLAQVSINNSALSDSQVANLFSGAFNVPTVATLTITSVTPGNGQATIAWTDPDATPAVTGYVVTSTPGGFTCTTVSASSCTIIGLTTGVPYTFVVQENTATGLGAPSAPSTSAVAEVTVPGNPTDVTATLNATTAQVSWTAPVNNGGSAISGYVVQYAPNPYSAWTTATSSASGTTYQVTGLSTGVSYEFRVAALNVNGQSGYTSTPSGVSATGVPDAPTVVSVVPGNTQVVVNWSAPANNGGAAITGYTVVSSPSKQSCSTTSNLTCTVTGLTNGTSYTFTVTATNINGTGPASAPSSPTTPFTVPGAPLNVSGAPADSSIIVSWNSPISNGGNPVSLYTVTASPGGSTCTSSAALSCTVTGLTNGTSYTFSVVATNAAGAGPASIASSPVSPAAAPGPPTSVSATNVPGTAYGSAASASVTWTAPSSTGSSAITGYTVTSYPNNFSCSTNGATTCTVTGLAAGDSYTFTVTASNSVATGSASVPSTALVAATVPGVPTSVSGTPGASGQVALTWNAPTHTGGAAISGYAISASSDGGTTWTPITANTSSATLSYTATGLTNGTAYQFEVAAINSDGTGNFSASSSGVTPLGAPSPPTSLVAAPGSSTASLTWSAPSNNGGAAITGYTVTSSPGGYTCTTAGATLCTITSLTPGQSYTFTATATNSLGTSTAGSTSNAVVPYTYPGPPTALSATLTSSSQATLTWTAPASNGYSAITSYALQQSTNGGTTWTPITASTGSTTTAYTVNGLSVGVTYQFEVAAINAAGTGPYSAYSASATAITAPNPPTAVVAVPGNALATISWQAPQNTGGTPITLYTATSSPGGFTCTSNSAPTCTVAGLTNYTSYTFTVTATNSVGTSTPSSPSASVTPTPPVPGPPTGVSATTAPTEATITWTAPASNGGSPITLYTVTSSPGGYTCTTNGTATTCTITGLLNATSYQFTVTATNINGTGLASAPSPAVSTPAAPGAPTGVTATGGNANAVVSWTAPSATNGSALVSYAVYYAVSPYTTWLTATANTGSTATSYTVAGLTNNTPYEYEVAATNGIGTGLSSAPSTPVETVVIIGGTTNFSCTGGSQSYTVPSSVYTLTYTINGAEGYVASGTGGLGGQVTGTLSVTPGEVLTVNVGCQGTSGSGGYGGGGGGGTGGGGIGGGGGGASQISNGSTALAIAAGGGGNGGDNGSVGGAGGGTTGATGGYAGSYAGYGGKGGSTTAGGAGGTGSEAGGGLTGNPGSSLNGGAGGASTGNVYGGGGGGGGGGYFGGGGAEGGGGGGYAGGGGGGGSSLVPSGSTTSTGVNAGNGTAQVIAATTYTSVTVPGVPTAPIAVQSGLAGANISWTAPISNGGSPITLYTATSSPGGLTCTSSSATSCAISGLTGSGTYTFSVTAVNSVGTSPASASSAPLTLATLPGAPNGPNTAASFSGSGSTTSIITAASVPTNLATGAVTVSAWVNITNSTPEQAVWGYDPNIALLIQNGQLYAYLGGNGGSATATAPATGTWNNITIVYAGNGSLLRTLYINGVAAASINNGATGNWTHTFSIGVDNSGGYLPFTGSVSQVAVIPSALTSTQVSALYADASASSPTYASAIEALNPTGYWPLNDPAGSATVADASGNNYTGTVSGGVTLGQPGPTPGPPTATNGVSGQSTITWTAPTSNGGSAITLYTVTSSPGGFTCTSASATNCTVTGLTNGTSYTFSVTATNSAGTGPASAHSGTISP